MNHGSCREPITPANWPGMTRRVECTSRSGNTAAGGRLLRRRTTAPATEAIEGQSLGSGGSRIESPREIAPPRQHDVMSGRMIVRPMRQRPAQGPQVAPLGEPRKVLTDVETGSALCRSAEIRREYCRGRAASCRSCRAATGRPTRRCKSLREPSAAPIGLAAACRNGSRWFIPRPKRLIDPASSSVRRSMSGC